jgi:20S proteasome alpha/beta subunit
MYARRADTAQLHARKAPRYMWIFQSLAHNAIEPYLISTILCGAQDEGAIYSLTLLGRWFYTYHS